MLINFIRRTFPLLAGILILSANVLCQTEPVPVEKSHEKILYHGKVYYLHAVVKGQTLYSISRAYGVSEQDIARANPGLVVTSIGTGQVLKIPVENNGQKTATHPPPVSSDGFIYHTVQAKQTVYYLHQLYNVPVEEIYRYNPGTENGLMIGQVVRIPKQASETKPEVKTQQNSQTKNQQTPQVSEVVPVTNQQQAQQQNKTYEVQPGDSLYRIAEHFGVREADLVNANPQLLMGLKVGQILNIPEIASAQSGETGADSLLLVSEVAGFSSEKCDSIKNFSGPRQLRIALMLPFFAHEAFQPDTTSIQDSLVDGETRPKDNFFRGRGAAEFYEGFLLALDSLKNSGLDLSLFVYDTEADTNKVKKILKDMDIVRPDLIVGPFFIENVRLVSRYSAANHIPFVPPLIQNDTVAGRNPYLFQCIPTFETELKLMAGYISRYDTENILLVYKNSLLVRDKVDQFKRAIHQYFPSSLPDSEIFTEMNSDSVSTTTLQRVLSDSIPNLVVVLSSEEPEVINVLSQLHQVRKNYDISVLGLPIWQKFKNVRIDYYHDLNVTVYSPFYIDYNNASVKNFVRKCRKILGYEPFKTSSKGTGYNFTFLGRDLGMYFIPMINDYGYNLCDCISNINRPQLLSEYKFIRNRHLGCFENAGLNIIQYEPDYTTKKIGFRNQN